MCIHICLVSCNFKPNSNICSFTNFLLILGMLRVKFFVLSKITSCLLVVAYYIDNNDLLSLLINARCLLFNCTESETLSRRLTITRRVT